ncbi:MAG: sulfotransferase domain-containing protein [Thiogranum sp.]
MREIQAVVTRHLILGLLFFMPRAWRYRLERRLRGKEEYRKLCAADWVLISWAKSGRTWFRVMLSRFYQVKHGLPRRHLLEFDNLHRRNAAIPRVLFSHNNYMRDYLKDRDTLNHFRGKKVVMLVRDPRDVAVSQFFQWKYRMRPHKIRLNKFPEPGTELGTFEFVTSPRSGIPKIIEFYNDWAGAFSYLGDILIVHYEDMRKDPAATMRQVLEFVGTPGSDAEIAQAVEFASLENMKKREKKSTFRGSSMRVKSGDPGNPDSFKTRRGKVGGYRDYFDDEQVTVVDKLVEEGLDPVFGYSTAAGTDTVTAGKGSAAQ